MEKKNKTEDFIEKARKMHGDKYDYSKVDYINNRTKVCIICPKHGEFWLSPDKHLFGRGCRKCKMEEFSMSKKSNTEEFIKKAREIHGDKYDYSKVSYELATKQVCIICPKHGEFWQTPHSHLAKKGCKKCGDEKMSLERRLTLDEFIEKSKEIHGDKYDYSKVKYINNSNKVVIICPIHGEFLQTPASHLNGNGCYECSVIRRANKKKIGKDEFINRAVKIHGEKYDYSMVDYVDMHTNVSIICPKHGMFMQTPHNHTCGEQGCPKCKQPKQEIEVKNILDKEQISYIEQCGRSMFSWIGRQTFDFYLPKFNVAIECQGLQHFKPIKAFGGVNTFNEVIERDCRKKKLCEDNGIRLIFYSNIKTKFPYFVCETQDQLINEIKKQTN